MALKAGNINVGSKTEPLEAPTNNELVGSFHKIRSNLKMQEPVVPEPVENDRYIIKKEGELIVSLNTKSHYLRDVLDLD